MSHLQGFTKFYACMDTMSNPTCLDRYSMAGHSSWVPLGSLQPFHATPPDQRRERLKLPTPSPLFTVSCWINESHSSTWTQTSFSYQVWSSTTSWTRMITFFSVKRPKCGIFGTFGSRSQTYDWIPRFPDGTSKNYIRYNSDDESSVKFFSVTEISHSMSWVHELHVYDHDFDLYWAAREVKSVSLIVPSNFGGNLEWFEKLAPTLQIWLGIHMIYMPKTSLLNFFMNQ